MIIKTKFLGEVEVSAGDIINFSQGLPGFGELQNFILLPIEGNPGLNYLQSIEEFSICFIVINPFFVLNDYDIELGEDTVQDLDINKPEDVQLYAILTITENSRDITVNLAAPVIVNHCNKKATQEILNTDKYSIKHRLFRGE